MRVIVCIPAYNEENTIGPVIQSCRKYTDSVFVIDDGSIDKTGEVSKDSGAQLIRNGRNMGKGAALKRGLAKCLECTPSVVITLDADGQHDPNDIPNMVKPILDGQADVVVGSRFADQTVTEVPFVRGIGLSLIGRMNRSLFRSSVSDSQSGFRAYSATVLRDIMEYSSDGYGAETEQLATAERLGYRVAEVPILIKYKGLKNTSKRSKLSHGADILSTILRMSVERRPLLLFGVSGIFFILAASVTLSYAVSLFNDTRYFSIPLAIITIGFAMIGALLILASLVFYAIKRIKNQFNHRLYTLKSESMEDLGM